MYSSYGLVCLRDNASLVRQSAPSLLCGMAWLLTKLSLLTIRIRGTGLVFLPLLNWQPKFVLGFTFLIFTIQQVAVLYERHRAKDDERQCNNDYQISPNLQTTLRTKVRSRATILVKNPGVLGSTGEFYAFLYHSPECNAQPRHQDELQDTSTDRKAHSNSWLNALPKHDGCTN